MPIEITMPKLSDTMEEGTLLKWKIKSGDRVSKGDIIAEVETDKAAMEMEAFDEGVVQELEVEEGDTVPVGTVIATFAREGEEKSAGEPEEGKSAEQIQKTQEPAEEKERKPQEKAETAEKEAEEAEAAEGAEEPAEEQEKGMKAGERAGQAEEQAEEAETARAVMAASPAARGLAREKGIELTRVRGTGPGGRVVLRDVEKYLEAGQEKGGKAPEKKGRPRAGGKKSVKIRRIVARKMAESWQTIPHFYVTVAVDMTDVVRFRKNLGVSINGFILAASARSLKEHPWVNSHWVEGEAVEQSSINIALAVATERGLYNPVLRDCGGLSLKEVGRRAEELSDKAHQGQLSAEELEGGTFTLSNMGMLGVESFSAIITPPQAAVLAVGTVKGEIVIDEHEEPVLAPILRLTLSADHRILDGADAAEFLATVKSYLEAPVTLISCGDGEE